MKHPKRWEHQHEPTPEGDEWIAFGGQHLWVAGFTEAGFPYGLTEEEFRAANARYDPEAGWARARRILETVIRKSVAPSAVVDIGYVKKMGEGLSRDIFAAQVEIAVSSTRGVYEIAILLPRGCDPNIDERTRKEARLLADLATMGLPFRVPRIFGVWPDAGHLALIRGFERGVELDLRAGRQARVRPWETVAKIAVTIHGITTNNLPWLEPRYSTRRDHALAAIREFDEICNEPEATDARAWMQEHLPPAGPSTFIHGDLLGQNILLRLGEPDAVIDWEYAQFGDPAHDLAIVTRGVRRPFQIAGGMDRLLEAYAQAGGAEMEVAHVHLHELALAARWYQDALNGDSPHAPAQQLQFLRSLLRRASTGAS